MTVEEINRDEWYTARDDRTRRIDGSVGFEDFSSGLAIESSALDEFSTQVMALTTANTLSRWCRHITVQIPEDVPSLIPSSDKNLRSVVEDIIQKSDPFCNLSFGDVNETDFSRIISIGHGEYETVNPHIWIDGSGWIAGAGYASSHPSSITSDDRNPVGPAFASCLGVAEAFRQAIGKTPPEPYDAWYSLSDFTKTSKDPSNLKNPQYVTDGDFGTLHQIGCGAVGSSLDFLLSLTEWTGSLYLIDFDVVNMTNCNRSLAFTAVDAQSKSKKVDACSRVLEKAKFELTTFDGDYSEFVDQNGFLNPAPDLILSLANERNVWAGIQSNFPPMVLHSTTTENWGLNLGRHIPKKEWCIMCRFARELDHRFKTECAEGTIKSQNLNTDRIMGVLPFLSPAAAVLILAEMAKMCNEGYPTSTDFVEFSLMVADSAFLQIQKGPVKGCVCHDQPIDLYPDEIKGGKFWNIGSL
ncbi:MAG: ThiF family adenylyltransferase [Candidatus Thorarchaeota archaeon]|jgi:hypothetical protein